MSNVISFECPRCGAPIQAAEGQYTVRCDYCGGVVIVPPELRPPPPPPPPRPTMINVVIDTARSNYPEIWTPATQAAPYAPPRTRRRRGGCVSFTVIVLTLGLVAAGLMLYLADNVPYFFDNLAAGGFARIDQTFDPQVDGSDLLKSPVDVSIDEQNNVYVLDDERQMVARFNQDGEYLNSWRLQGKNKGVSALVADRAGGVTVVSGDLMRYDASTGSLIGTGGVADIFGLGDLCLLPDGRLIGYANGSLDSLVLLNQAGAETGRKERPISESTTDSPPVTWQARLAAGKDGSVYLLSTSFMNEAVYVYGPDLSYKLRFGTNGDAEGELDSPSAIAVDSKGRIYVADWKGVQVFDGKGNYIGIIRLPFHGLVDGMAFNNRDELYLVSKTQPKVYKFVLN